MDKELEQRLLKRIHELEKMVVAGGKVCGGKTVDGRCDRCSVQRETTGPCMEPKYTFRDYKGERT